MNLDTKVIVDVHISFRFLIILNSTSEGMVFILGALFCYFVIGCRRRNAHLSNLHLVTL